MNVNDIAQLRADSLAATLSAARHRRVRRHGVVVLGGAAALVAMSIALLPMREATRTFTGVSRPAPGQFEVSPPQAESSRLIRTSASSVVRITSISDISHIRVNTAPAMSVERIDSSDLRACFPEKGIAFIGKEAGPPGFVVF